MGNFKPGNRAGGFGNRSSSGRPRSGSSFGGRDRDRGRSGGFGGRDRNRDFRRSDGPTEMFDSVCGKCGKKCQVPFKPTGSRPVLCSDCFRQSSSDRGPRESFGSRNQDRRSFGSSSNQSGISSEQFNQINAKLDKIIKTLQELEMYDEDDESEEDSDEDAEDEDEEGEEEVESKESPKKDFKKSSKK